MSNVMDTAASEMMRRNILELCSQAADCGAGIPVMKAALRKSGQEATDQELMQQVRYLEGKGLVETHVVENRRLGIRRCIVFLTPCGTDYLEGNGPDIVGIG